MSLNTTKTTVTNSTIDADITTVVSKNRLESNSSLVGEDGTQIGNTGDKLKTDGSGVTQPVSAATLPLPAGASTSALQTQPGVDIGDVTVNNGSGAGAINIQDGGNSITVDGPLTDTELRATPVPISVASLPLPSGASTSALQTSGNASLSSIDTKLVQETLNFGAATGAVRVASIIGNASAVADFGSGVTTAQTLRVVLPSNFTVPVAAGGDLFLTNNQLYSIGASVNGASSGTDNPMVLIRNPVGSGKDMYIQRIQGGTAVSNVAYIFDAWSTPTVTANGTAVTPVANFINNGAPASVMLITTLPTVSSKGSVLSSLVQGQNSNSVVFNNEFRIGIKPGGSMLITGSPASNNRVAEISISWAEV